MSTTSMSILQPVALGKWSTPEHQPWESQPSENLGGQYQLTSPASLRYLLRKARKHNLWALEAWSVNTLLSLSVGVITDLTILWIDIQSNKHSWGDCRKYSQVSGCQSDQSTLVHVPGQKGRHAELAGWGVKMQGVCLPGSISKN